MPQQPYSVEQVANLLGLHVKTVRNYVRDGRLKAVRIGKQYRIAREDLEAFMGGAAEPAAETAGRRHMEASSIVQIDAISPEEMMSLGNTLVAAAVSRSPAERPLRVETIYDEERASMKIIIVGGVADTAEMFRLVTTLVKEPA
ncbi:helix-turn-helix domain-containing protein [Microbispora sp. H10830]|uniref:helix-turn-helix domain-containing protein n=1 Tax=Microbispora sp. H10830 TaxID=2729109 RepID=UPI001600439B|nr:helix-turn-helix domain-containing protein [Microbispora sp. H10830]